MKLFILIGLLCFQQVYSQKVIIHQEFRDGNEPSLVINPKNNSEIVIAFNKNNVFRSNDTGQTFSKINVYSKYGFYGDPVLMTNQRQEVLLVHLANNKKQKWPESFDRIVFQSFGFNSQKVKESVGIGYQPGKMQDKPWLFVQNSSNTRTKEKIHITWTCFDKYDSRAKGDSTRIMHSYSSNNGKSFSTPQIISKVCGIAVDGDSAMEGATMCMDKKTGHLYCMWSGMNQLWFTLSKDGKTWETPKAIGTHENGWNISAPGFWRANGMPFLASLNENIIAIWAAEVNGISKVYYMFYDITNSHWGNVKSIEIDEGISAVMPFIQTNDNKAYVVFYGIGNKDTLTLESEASVYYAKIDENKPLEIVIGKKIEQSKFKTKNSFLGDYIGLGLLNQSKQEEGIVAFTILKNNKTTFIATSRIKF
jgi:hypothetical protein